jgi:Ca2+:H+ antiporter
MLKSLRHSLLVNEPALWLAWLTVLVFIVFGNTWLSNLQHAGLQIIAFTYLFLIILWNSFEVAHHVEALAESLQEPYSTVILTLTVISIEVSLIANIMLTGPENPTLARDTMYAVVMIILNGFVGLSLLLGGLRYQEQQYNLQGSIAFLSVIILLAVVGLVLPNFTHSTSSATFSPFQEIFLIVTSLGIYGIFLMIQTVSHRTHFVTPFQPQQTFTPFDLHIKYPAKSIKYHVILLIAYLIPTLFLAKQAAIPINFILGKMGAPSALGGLLVAILVVAPEGVSAIRASLANQLQRSVNISLGSVLASIGLTIPVILIIGLITGKTVILGLDYSDTTILVLTAIMSILTFVSGRTNILQGAIHLLLFFAYILMIFD